MLVSCAISADIKEKASNEEEGLYLLALSF